MVNFLNDLEHIIIHYTAGSNRQSSVDVLCDPKTKASSHFILGRDEKITQMLPCNIIAWHAGRSKWKDKINLNHCSIGIELDNAGSLQKLPNGDFQSWFQKRFRDLSEVFLDEDGQGWHQFTDWQIAKVIELCQLLVNTYPSIKYILGHNEISPGRKIDPGKAFPIDRVRSIVFDNSPVRSTSEKSMITETNLNIRNGPGTNFPTKSDPLPQGTEVVVLEEKDGWSRVRVTMDGWVSSKYLLNKIKKGA